jgi:hypothetical protein
VGFPAAVLTRAIKAAEKAGEDIVGAEIDSVTGKFELRFQSSVLLGRIVMTAFPPPLFAKPINIIARVVVAGK